MANAYSYPTANRFLSLPESSITVTGATATNRGRLTDGLVDKQWNSEAVGSFTIDFDLGSAGITLDGIALINHNGIEEGTTVQVKAAEDSGFSVNVVTPKSTSQLYGKNSVLQFTALSTKRYWRLEIVGAGGSVEFKCGEIWGYSKALLTRGLVYGDSKEQLFKTVYGESDTGRQFGHFLAGPIVKRRLMWGELTASERNEIVAMHAAVKGNARQLLWIESHETGSAAAAEAQQECYVGRLLDPLNAINSDYNLYTGLELTFLEESRGVGL